MRTLLIAVLLLGAAAAGPLSAADVPGGRDTCPDRLQGDNGKAYGVRARDYCQMRWRGELAAHSTMGQTHDEFIDGCLRRCVTLRNATSGAPLDWILGGVWSGTLAYGLTAGGGGSGSRPASP